MQQKEMTIFKKISQPFTKLKTLNNIKWFRQPACMYACLKSVVFQYCTKLKYARNKAYNLESSRNYDKSIQALKLFEILENYYFIVACLLIVIFSPPI